MNDENALHKSVAHVVRASLDDQVQPAGRPAHELADHGISGCLDARFGDRSIAVPAGLTAPSIVSSVGREHRAATHRPEPTVKIISQQPAGVGGVTYTVERPCRPQVSGERVNRVMVLALLVASTALALYDLYLLLMIVTSGR